MTLCDSPKIFSVYNLVEISQITPLQRLAYYKITCQPVNQNNPLLDEATIETDKCKT